MAVTIKLKNASGSDPSASDLVVGEVAVRTDTAKLFTKKDDNSIAEIGANVSADSVDTNAIQDDAVTADKLASNAVVNASVSSSAAIAGSKIDPDFGSQNVVTTGTLSSGNITVSNNLPKLFLTDANNNSDFSVQNTHGVFTVHDETNTADRLTINSSGLVTVPGNLDCSSGVDVTGNITVSGTVDGRDVATDGTKLDGIASGATNVSTENIQDIVGGMVTGNTETGITVTYQDGDGTLDFVVGTLNQDTTGNAATATALETARNIGGVSFDGTGNINLPGVNTSGNQNTSGNAATATKLATARTIAGVSFDGSANISLNNNAITNGAGYLTSVGTSNIANDAVTNAKIADDAIEAAQLDNNCVTAAAIAANAVGSSELADDAVDTAAIANDAVTYAKIQNVSTDNRILGRNDGVGSGVVQELTPANLRTMLNVADGATNVTNNNQLTNGAGYITSANGGNAATLDSLDSTQFLRSDTENSGSGVLNLSGGIAFTNAAKCSAAVSALSDGSTITVNFTSGIHHSVTLGGNRTFGNPSNDANAVGQCGSIFITQDGTGGRTASFHSDYKFVGGTAPTLSTAANAVDRLDYIIKASGVIHCVVSLDVK